MGQDMNTPAFGGVFGLGSRMSGLESFGLWNPA